MESTAQGLLGLILITALAWQLSENRRAVNWRIAVAGLGLQLILALLLLKLPLFQQLFLSLNGIIMALQNATQAGTAFVFGYLGGGAAPFTDNNHGNSFILAFRALPLILVMSALSALLFHWRILPLLVQAFAWLLGRTMGIGGALGLSATANIFVGMIEAPLLVRPYLKEMSRSELFALMASGMATIAGTMMALYATILGHTIPDAMGHIFTASLISAPAALMMALIMIPGSTHTASVSLHNPDPASSSMDAITRGTIDGMKLLANIIVMLVVLVALVNLVNQILALLPSFNSASLTLERMLGWLMAPMAWLMGIPWSEASTAGALMGTKTVLNEFIAYLQMAALPEGALSQHSKLIMTYAMCGFANLGSLGIMLGGMAAMVPERRGEIVELGMKSIVAGTLATCLTGTIAGLILS
ncbi:nucleoside:proton symporter [Mariprofundus erugo]|uniref:NupC/NupG family nucleoside CNT transporter n=1 Tax=Mariprofundus erugo TaxID=2528639 RepID=UPI0010FEBD66|nr:nucleoside transporter C-terminal domain-containing protein [Mariprofundus erugo]TLS73721.1 nucleoside:proton symporter [Mariprofundus erugo]